MYDRGHHRRFADRIEDEAAAAAARSDHEPRRDLTGLPTFTIDPVSAKDYDDALSVERDGDALRLYVHIADVAAFVRPGTALDSEAERRATSAYVPGAVESMLPGALSNEACSLVPGLPRLTVTVEVLLGPDARVRSTSFYRSTIRSDARLVYRRRGPGVRGAGAGARDGRGATGARARACRNPAGAPPVAGRARGRELGARVRLRRGRECNRRARRDPDRVPLGDRAPDDPRQRAGGGAPVHCPGRHDLPRARAAGPRIGRAPRGAAREPRRPDPGAPRAHHAAASRRGWWGRSAGASSTTSAPPGEGGGPSASWCCAQ